MTRVICLTGGLASGKSTAARHLRELGAHVIDADLLGHRVYEPGSPAHARIAEVFGREIVAADGRIDRKALGTRVFGQPAELKKLTDIVWPAIRRLAAQEIAQLRAAGRGRPADAADAAGSGGAATEAPVIVLEAAVLFEAGWQDLGDEVWVNVVDREVAIERAMARDGAMRQAVEGRLDAQLSNAERMALADVVIDNNGREQDLLAQVRRHWQRVKAQPVLRMPHVGPQVELEDLALLHPTAQLHGKVHIGPGASVWPYVVMRSEMHHIRIGARTNLQDFVMVHVGNNSPTLVGEDCSITHHVTLHGCEIGDRCLIGINATIMDGAKIGANSIVAGHAIVMQNQVFPENSIIGGVPAKLIATRDNGEANVRNARFYEEIARRLVRGEERLRDE
jgi:dephospho-CoA kinase/carbonic anhydrase/acetyltransferase-like protein (isoleucine patch superfamily)